MGKRFHLTLMIGPRLPVPVAPAVLDALTDVEITTSPPPMPDGFRLSFTLDKRSPVHTAFLLAGGVLSVGMPRVIVTITVNGLPDVLMDGVITRREVTAGGPGGASTLTLTGVDISAVMERVELDGFPFPAMPPDARVRLILAKYAAFGVVPVVVPALFADVPNPAEQVPQQQGHDRDYVCALASDIGYVFYLTPGPAPGLSVAYWGPEIRMGVPQPALNVDMDAHTNVESLTFGVDDESRTLPVVFVHEPLTKLPIPIPIPDISLLNPPLALVPPGINRITSLGDTARLNPVRAALKGLARASRSAEAVSGWGTLNVLRYGRVLKARQLVAVRGAGTAFNGLYYVKNVTHTIERGTYTQQFSLTRNGLVSTVPRVRA